MNVAQLSWAIDTRSGEGHGFIGRYWRFGLEDHTSRAGHVLRPRLFETRKEARVALKEMKSKDYVSFPKARVARVSVIVEGLGWG